MPLECLQSGGLPLRATIVGHGDLDRRQRTRLGGNHICRQAMANTGLVVAVD